MATQDRDDRGRFGSKMRDQNILIVFDYEATVDDPYMTVKEVTAGLAEHFDIEVSAEAVRVRLEQMLDADTIAKRQFGASVAYRALVGPALADDVKAEAERRANAPDEDFVPLDEL